MSLFEDEDFEEVSGPPAEKTSGPEDSLPPLTFLIVKVWDRGEEKYQQRLKNLSATECVYEHGGHSYVRWKFRVKEDDWASHAAAAGAQVSPLVDSARLTLTAWTWERDELCQRDYQFNGVTAELWERSLPRNPKE